MEGGTEISHEEAIDRAGRLRERVSVLGGDRVEILAVTKGFGPWAIKVAAQCGFQNIGESYAQELTTKWSQMDPEERESVDVHFIGRMQTNKVRKVAPIVKVWQTVDRPSLIQELSKRCPGSSVMLQIKLAQSEAQGGCQLAEASELLAMANAAGLDVTGLMAIGPQGEDEIIRAGYKEIVSAADEWGLKERSIGMSNDLEIAIECGSTMVRIGTALFGDRPAR